MPWDPPAVENDGGDDKKEDTKSGAVQLVAALSGAFALTYTI